MCALDLFVRSLGVMSCNHDGFHGFRSSYDRSRGVLVYFWTCESCGRRLGEARREEYRPQFDRRGNDQFLTLMATR
jgi:hypothetical protein